MNHRLFLLGVTLVLFGIVCSGASGISIKGVSPADTSSFQGVSFTCKDGSKTIPFDSVNDNYCDCQDGSDEPGTSACNAGSFFCENKGFVARSIPSWQVGDTICDCCDGSDEWQNPGQCENTCKDLADSSNRALKEELATLEKGLARKKSLIEKVPALIAEMKSKVEQSKRDLQALNEEAKPLRELKDAAEASEKEASNAASELLDKETEAYKQKVQQAQEPTKDLVDAPVPFDQTDRSTPKFGVATTIPPEDSTSDEGEEEEEEGEADADEDFARKFAEANPADYEQLKEVSLPDDEKSAGLVALLEKKRVLQEASAAARDRFFEVDRKVADLENEIRENEKNLDFDYGLDHSYYVLANQCIDLQTDQYKYTLCPFKSVTQGHTSLGEWNAWGEDRKTQMYTGGTRCWQGPDRSTKVVLVCGEDNKITKVEEPSKCEYVMTFETPLACFQDDLERLRAQLIV